MDKCYQMNQHLENRKLSENKDPLTGLHANVGCTPFPCGHNSSLGQNALLGPWLALRGGVGKEGDIIDRVMGARPRDGTFTYELQLHFSHHWVSLFYQKWKVTGKQDIHKISKYYHQRDNVLTAKGKMYPIRERAGDVPSLPSNWPYH